MPGRHWTKREVRLLYQYAEQTSQLEAARKLGKTHRAVRSKATKLGIRWGQGFYSLQDLAIAAGCNAKQAKRVLDEIYKDGIPGHGRGSGARYQVSMEDAERVVNLIRDRYGRIIMEHGTEEKHNRSHHRRVL